MSAIEFKSSEGMSDREFLRGYWGLVLPIWQAFQKGAIGASRRDEELRPHRDRLTRITARTTEAQRREMVA